MIITSNFHNMISFGYKKKPVRVFSKEEGSKRYDSVLDAAKAENIEYRNITKAIKGETKIYNGKVFLYAKDVEDENENLNTQKALDIIKDRLKNGQTNVPVWKFNPDGSYVEYKNKRQMLDDSEISNYSIRQSLNGARGVVLNSVFLSSADARTLDEDGKIGYDFEKIQQIAAERFDKRAKLQAEKEEKIAAKRLEKETKLKLEKEAKEKFKEEAKKLKEESEIKAIKENMRTVPIYLISPNVEPVKFKSITEASENTNIANARISDILHGKRTSKKDRFFVFANEIEEKDENGNISLDIEKINRLNQERQEKSVVKRAYLIDSEGNIKKACKTAKEMDKSKEFHNALNNGQSGILLPNGDFLIYAKDVETIDESGRIIVERNKINKVLSEIETEKQQEARKYSVWALCPDGTFEYYKNADEAAKANLCATSNIRMCLSGRSKSAKEKYFFWAKDIEKTSENGEYLPDYKKCREILIERGLLVKANILPED